MEGGGKAETCGHTEQRQFPVDGQRNSHVSYGLDRTRNDIGGNSIRFRRPAGVRPHDIRELAALLIGIETPTRIEDGGKQLPPQRHGYARRGEGGVGERRKRQGGLDDHESGNDKDQVAETWS